MRANKDLGQHFIYDQFITDQIVSLCNNFDGTTIEIGPGPGTLTKSLLKKVSSLIVIEKDSRFLNNLKKINQNNDISIIHTDALSCDLSSIAQSYNIRIVGNLPYNIATKLLYQWIEYEKPFCEMILMFQKEVGLRITASPHQKHYGKLSIMVQNLYNTSLVMTLPPEIFTPPPKVESVVIKFEPRNDFFQNIVIKKSLNKITSVAFSQRRKMLRQALNSILKTHTNLLYTANLDPKLRPENLHVSDWQKLAQLIT